ncbi:MAG: hypothetical protein M5U28_31695 [Sandaracinaceae bacterium]|nr:hypothetical protein [Sandaracinaceae bacterium]
MLARNESVTMAAGLRAALREDTEVPDGVPSQWLAPVADDLASHRGQAVVVVGSGQPAHVHALAHAINAALGAVGAAVAYFPPADLAEPDHVASLRELTDAMREGQVSTLVVLGGNPVYDAPADLRFAEALERVETSIALSALLDETSSRCTWHLPLAHAFESWGDHRSLEGLVSIQQPLIAPLRRGRAEHEVLALLAGVRGWRGYSQVRATVREMVGASPQLERIWRQSLHRGIVLGGARPTPLNPALRDAEIAAALSEAAQPAAEGWEVVFRPSYQTHDGRFATAAWLLEMPEPITKVAWDNAAWMSPASARELGIPVREGGYGHGALVTLAREGASEGDAARLRGARARRPRGDAAARLGPHARRRARHGGRLRRLSVPHERRARLRHGRAPDPVGRQLRARADAGAPLDGGPPARHRRDARAVPRDARLRAVARAHAGARSAVDAGRLLGPAPARAGRHDLLALPRGALAEARRAPSLQVGHGRGPHDLHRLQRVRGRLPGGEQQPHRGQAAGGARPRDALDARRSLLRGRGRGRSAGRHPADALPALRGGALRERVPGQRDGAQPRGHQRDGLQPLHRHAVLHEQLPLQGAAVQLPRLARRPGRARAHAVQPERHGADARRDGEVHVLRAAHPGGAHPRAPGHGGGPGRRDPARRDRTGRARAQGAPASASSSRASARCAPRRSRPRARRPARATRSCSAT